MNGSVQSGLKCGSVFTLIALIGAIVAPPPISGWFELLF